MAKPICTQKFPYVKELAAGTYWWCSCGKSVTQPFCDGAHKGSEFAPVKLEVTATDEKVYLCGCRHSLNPPHCDGAHKNLP